MDKYVTLVIVFGLFFHHCKNEVNGTFAFLLVLLCFPVLICLFRILLIFHNEGERKFATDDEREFIM